MRVTVERAPRVPARKDTKLQVASKDAGAPTASRL